MTRGNEPRALLRERVEGHSCCGQREGAPHEAELRITASFSISTSGNILNVIENGVLKRYLDTHIIAGLLNIHFQ